MQVEELYRIVGISYAVIMVFWILLPFYRKARAKRIARLCRGKTIESKYGFPKICESLLTIFSALRKESVIVLFLDDKNLCNEVFVRFGAKKSKRFLEKEIYEKTLLLLKSSKVIVMYNYRKDMLDIGTTPDIQRAATLYNNLPKEVKLSGYVVQYVHKVFSLIDSSEFKKLISKK